MVTTTDYVLPHTASHQTRASRDASTRLRKRRAFTRLIRCHWTMLVNTPYSQQDGGTKATFRSNQIQYTTPHNSFAPLHRVLIVVQIRGVRRTGGWKLMNSHSIRCVTFHMTYRTIGIQCTPMKNFVLQRRLMVKRSIVPLTDISKKMHSGEYPKWMHW